MSIKVKSKKTGVESSFTQKEWDDIQKNPFWDGVFIPVKDTTPKEVKELEARKIVEATTPAKPEVAKPTNSNKDQSIKTIVK